MPRSLVVPQPRPAARHRLVICPHAGGGASFYRAFSALFAPEIEVQIVQYPGRENRLGEPLVADLYRLVDEVAGALRDTDDGWAGTALLGHSMGAAVAHETALVLQRAIPVTDLFVSGRQAPGTAPVDSVPGTAEEVLAAVQRLGGMPPELLADPDLREYFLGILTNDYRLVGAYRHRGGGPLTVDLTALWSVDDPQVDGDGVGRWRDFTTGRYREHVFAGGHFYLVAEAARVARLVRSQLLDGVVG